MIIDFTKKEIIFPGSYILPLYEWGLPPGVMGLDNSWSTFTDLGNIFH